MGTDVWYTVEGTSGLNGGKGYVWIRNYGEFPWPEINPGESHCWEHINAWDYLKEPMLELFANDPSVRIEFTNCTCMLKGGHEGEHMYIADSEISVGVVE